MIISGAAADAEIAKVKPAEIEDAGLASFAYLRLDDEDFERLCYALSKRSAPLGVERIWDDAALMVRGADAGRDVLLTKGGVPVGVIQCKRLEGQMALPAVFREMAKLILFASVNGDLRFDRELIYMLTVARDPARTVVDYFARRSEVEPAKRDAIMAAAVEVRDTYATLARMDDEVVERLVFASLPKLSIKLLRPVDLDEWMGREGAVAARFFKQRIVVDNQIVSDRLDAFEGLLRGLAGDVQKLAPVTDEDLELLREQIRDTPETHRLNLGIAMLFGFPPEMFVGRPNLEKRVGRLRDLLQEVDADYTDWVFALAREKAAEICDSAEAMYAPMIARAIVAPFLGYVAKECLAVALSGSIMSSILDRLSNAPRLESDEARLRQAREDVASEWGRYLAGDFGQMIGDAEDLKLKRLIVERALEGLRSQEHLENALEMGADLLKQKLFDAADSLRATCKHKVSIVLTGSRGIDSDAGLKRLADTVRSLEALKRSGEI
ncbi:MAG: hypothetical protein ACK4K7_14300 [Allosphingosinicella sp.]|uniref:hypothetical protein n=1 Tax=Allosphingosinicella sp. TaxID=2823234 RepID=UPI0039291E59